MLKRQERKRKRQKQREQRKASKRQRRNRVESEIELVPDLGIEGVLGKIWEKILSEGIDLSLPEDSPRADIGEGDDTSGGSLGRNTPANSELGLLDKVKNFVKDLWVDATKFNFENRDANNINLPTQDEIGNQPGWRREYKDAFHQNGGARDEKWVNDLDGREVVYDGDTGQILTDQYRGTYNYMNVAPNPQKWYDVGGWLKVGGTMVGHGVMDVAPWYILGIDRKE